MVMPERCRVLTVDPMVLSLLFFILYPSPVFKKQTGTNARSG